MKGIKDIDGKVIKLKKTLLLTVLWDNKMESRELEIKEKWSPIKSQSDDNIKQIAKDLYNGLIYTDRHWYKKLREEVDNF